MIHKYSMSHDQIRSTAEVEKKRKIKLGASRLSCVCGCSYLCGATAIQTLWALTETAAERSIERLLAFARAIQAGFECVE